MGLGKVAPAPFNVVCPMTGSARARPANNTAMRWFTLQVLLIWVRCASLFYGRSVKGRLQRDEFLMNALRFQVLRDSRRDGDCPSRAGHGSPHPYAPGGCCFLPALN